MNRHHTIRPFKNVFRDWCGSVSVRELTSNHNLVKTIAEIETRFTHWSDRKSTPRDCSVAFALRKDVITLIHQLSKTEIKRNWKLASRTRGLMQELQRFVRTATRTANPEEGMYS